jgi:Tol biopolymer transport system component
VVKRWVVVWSVLVAASCGGTATPTMTTSAPTTTTPLATTTAAATLPSATTAPPATTSTTVADTTTTTAAPSTTTGPTEPSGTIWFTADDTSGKDRYGAWKLDVASETFDLLTAKGGVAESHPRPSPDGTRIAYASLDPGDDHNQFVWVAHPDGSHPAQASVTPAQFWDWLPGGSELLVGSFAGWNPRASFLAPGDMALLDVATGLVTPIVDIVGDEDRNDPVVAPGGTTVAYIGVVDGELIVWFLDLASGEEHAVTPGSALSWSPDGSMLAVERDATIWVVGSDGSGARQLLSDPAVGFTNPAWSPDGKWIAYVRDDGATDEIWVMRTDGSDLRQVSSGSPKWVHDLYWGP